MENIKTGCRKDRAIEFGSFPGWMLKATRTEIGAVKVENFVFSG